VCWHLNCGGLFALDENIGGERWLIVVCVLICLADNRGSGYDDNDGRVFAGICVGSITFSLWTIIGEQRRFIVVCVLIAVCGSRCDGPDT
jgi:hypothetical protein